MPERSPPPRTPILLVDSDPNRRGEFQTWLDQSGFGMLGFPDAPSLLSEAVGLAPTAILVGSGIEPTGVLELLQELEERGSAHAVSLIGDPGERAALALVRAGAVDCRPVASAAEANRLVVETLERATCRGWLRVARAGEAQLERLTPREHETLALVLDGLPSKTIAQRLGVTTKTVEQHRSNVMHKLEVASVAQLVLRALKTRSYGVPYLAHPRHGQASGEGGTALPSAARESAANA